MLSFIKNLQGKPESTKKVVMWSGVIVIMIAIFGVWIFTFSNGTVSTAEDPALTNLKKEMPGVWQTFKTQIGALQNLWQK